ncbi:expressed unknown protein [Seminavis robusta]|uniref:Uncharacterized protein n=1 Tax=Seminavis robusta TaxID=568900 RepID=A0A9N8ERA2_9STRA|nr:expressed unknown protein [Seminavis robusta]|eukprot:Sro1613_g286030.1 n/a (539) ;mRNA; r:15866-17559
MMMLRSLTVCSLLTAVSGYVHNDPPRDKTRPHNAGDGAQGAQQRTQGQTNQDPQRPQQQQRPQSAATTAGSAVNANKQMPPFPHFRFISWDKMSENVRHHAHKVGYQEKNWNKPGAHNLERLSFDDIHANHIQVYDELMAMGFEAGSQWDCYINHYRALDWANLGAHQQDYQVLGWTQALWDDGEEEAETEGGYWTDMTPQQQIAASNLCYTQEMWDDVVLPLWGQDDGKGGETDQDENNNSNHNLPQKQVDQKQDVYDTIYDEQDRTPDTIPIGPNTAHNSRGVETPFFRYNAWSDLSADVKKLAHQADYNGKTWNSLDTEKMDFETIGEEDPEIHVALVQLGFTAKVWDCYMIHYRSYEWGELKDAGVQQYYATLGWTEDSWNDEADPPATDGAYWPDLSQEQQDAAYELCYFRETWDEVSMQFWPRTTVNSPVEYAKDYAKTHPASASGAVVITITVLIGLLFCCACCCKFLFFPSTPQVTTASRKDLEMYRYDERDIHAQVYRDDPAIITDDSNSAKFTDAVEDFAINNKASIV